jgi:DNA-binding GntR family transcriptional regulator
MFELTLTGGELASINIIATSLQRAREKLAQKGLLDTKNKEVQEHQKAVEEVVAFTENMLPLFFIDTAAEVYETSMVVDSYCLACITRVLQKSVDEASGILVNEYQAILEAKDAGDADKAIELCNQHLENLTFYMILSRALIRVTETLTGADDYPQLH